MQDGRSYRRVTCVRFGIDWVKGIDCFVMGNLTGQTEGRVMEEIVCIFGVSYENDNGGGMVNFCAETGCCVGDIYNHKYIRLVRDRDG